MSRPFFVVIAAGACLAASLSFIGCGSSSKAQPSPPVSVSLNAGSAGSSPAIDAGQTVSIVAVLVNDSSNAGVKWSLSGAGSLESETPTSVVYAAPSTVSAAFIATVTATSVADSADTGSIKITVNVGPLLPPPQITVSIGNGISASTIVDVPLALTATVKNDPKNAGVQWSMTGAGSLSNETTTSATFNTPAYVAENTTPLATVTATSISDLSVSGSLQIITFQLYAGCTAGLPPAYCDLPIAVFTQPYTATLPAMTIGGVPPYQWTFNGPPNLTFNAATGVISGAILYSNGGAAVNTVYVTVTDSTTPTPNRGYGYFGIPMTLPTVLTILTPSLPASSVGATYNQTLLATAGTPPYNWSISSGALPPGLTINGSTSAITGAPTTTGTYNFVVEVTDSAAPTPGTYTANFSITIEPQLAFATTSLPAGSVGTAYVQPLQATGGVPPYSFSLQNGSTLPPGLSLGSAIAGVPTTTGTTNFTVVANDSAGGTATSNLSISITAANCPNNAILNGHYAFLLSGPVYPEAGGPSSYLDYVGSFVADGAGNITQGYMDSGSAFASGTQPATLTGSYCVSANNIGTVILDGFGTPAANTFQVAFQSGSSGNVIIFENQPNGSIIPDVSGVLLQQDTSAFNTTQITGNYAFELLGGGLGLTAQAGLFTADGAGNLTNGELDMDFTGTLTSAAAFSANNLIVASTGRGTVNLNAPAVGTVSVVFYVVNAAQLLALESVSSTPYAVPLLAGQIVQQATGSYSDSSLNGISVIGLQSRDSNDAPVVQVGLITWDGAGNFTWSADQNDAGTMSTPSYTGTYSVASNGRVTLNVSGQTSPPILYLTGPNQGFVVGTDVGVTSGSFFSQSGSPFTTSSFSGSYFGGNWQITDETVNLEADALIADGAGDISGTSDTDSFATPPYGPAMTAVSGTYSVSPNGRGTITQNGSVTGIFYIVSPTQILMLPSGNPNPDLVSLSR